MSRLGPREDPKKFMEPAYEWINAMLPKGAPKVTRIGRNFSDGTLLAELLKKVSKDSKNPVAIPDCFTKNPKNLAEKRRNIATVLILMENQRMIKRGTLHAQDILWGSLKKTYALIRKMNIISHGRLKQLPPKFEEAPEDPPEVQEPEAADPVHERVTIEESIEIHDLQQTTPSSFILAIDFGTQYIRYGVYVVGVLYADNSEAQMRSEVVCYQNAFYVDEYPEGVDESSPVTVITELRRVIGRSFRNEGFGEFVQSLPYEVVQDKTTDRPVIRVQNGEESNEFTPEELTARIFQRVRELACKKTGQNVVEAVVTVPSFYGEAERRALIDAGKIVGLNIYGVMGEADAAALSHAASEKSDKTEYICVFEMGAGMVQVNLVQKEGTDTRILDSKGADIGGRDIDRLLEKEYGKDFAGYENNPQLVEKLRNECENVKILLSTKEEAEMIIRNFYDGRDLCCTVTRQVFDDLCHKLFENCVSPLKDLFKDGNVKKEDVCKVILLGGSTNIVKLRTMINDFFEGKAEIVMENNQMAAVDGAAMKGTMMKAPMADAVSDITLEQYAMHSLGTDVIGGRCVKIIKKGTRLPTDEVAMSFSTVSDNQTSVSVMVLQGESDLISENQLLGKKILSGIQQAPAGVPQIEVMMKLDENGMIQMRARDKTTGSDVEGTFNTGSNLDPETLARLTAQAQEQAAAQQLERKQTVARTKLEQDIHSARNMKGKLAPDVEQQIDNVIDTAEQWMHEHPSENPSAYLEKRQELRQQLDELITKD